ncbi:MAG: DUF4097 domain-containing protein [Acidobacteriia bacterium]|nr:DUF4097 domain-containing protein [Terriglobia bacterium]
MKQSTRWYSIFVVTLLLLAVAPLLARDSAEGSFNRTLKVEGPVDLTVETGSGHINIRAGGGTAVVVTGTIKAQDSAGSRAEERVRQLESNPPIEQTGNIIHIGRITDHDLRQNISISYEVVVPADTRVHASTGSGSQTIEGIRGPLSVSSGSGSLKILNIGGEVRAEAGSGSIGLDAIKGSVHARAGSGSIHASDIAGGFTANTGSGSVVVSLSAIGDVNVETGSGSVEVNGIRGLLGARTGSGRIRVEGAPTGNWKLHTGSGGIDVKLPPDAAFDLYAHTGSGRVTTSHPITVQGTLRPSEIQGKVRGGGFLLDVHTGSGNIQIN